MVPNRLRDALPENDKAGLLAVGLILLMISQYLSNKTTSPWLIVLRYVLFIAALAIYGYVLYVHNRERIKKKRKREEEQQS